jgi:hypothetical protein
MDICYLCGLEMHDPKTFVKNQELENFEPVFKHDEHIIQNALYGRLISDTILCKGCGSKLADQVDTRFVPIFQTLTEQISHILAPKSRNNGKSLKAVQGRVKLPSGKMLEIVYVNGKIIPKRPDHELLSNGTLNIYSEKSSLKNYAKSKTELLKKDNPNIVVEQYSEIKEYSELEIDFTKQFKDFHDRLIMGFAKIAVGYASNNGIRRQDMPLAIDFENSTLHKKPIVIPYYSCGNFNKIYDLQRDQYETEYPTHTLSLFVEPFGENQKALICMVELLSTFTYYVILNDNYLEDIDSKIYYQSILRSKPKTFEIHGRLSDPKELSILLTEMEISADELPSMDPNEIEEFIEKRKKQYTAVYKHNLSECLTAASENILKTKNHLALANRIQNKIKNRQATPVFGDLSAFQFFHLVEEIKHLQKDPLNIYKKYHIDDGDDQTTELTSTLGSCIDSLELDSKKISDNTKTRTLIFMDFVEKKRLVKDKEGSDVHA